MNDNKNNDDKLEKLCWIYLSWISFPELNREKNKSFVIQILVGKELLKNAVSITTTTIIIAIIFCKADCSVCCRKFSLLYRKRNQIGSDRIGCHLWMYFFIFFYSSQHNRNNKKIWSKWWENEKRIWTLCFSELWHYLKSILF